MKYKKYILMLLLVIFIGWNKVEASDCYYISNGFAAKYDTSNYKVTVNKYGNKLDEDGNGEKVKNINKSHKINSYVVPAYTNTNACPTYLVLHYDRVFPRNLHIYATDDITVVNSAVDYIGSKKKHFGFYAQNRPGMSEAEYRNEYAQSVFKPSPNGYGGTDYELTCDELFGNKNDPDSLAYLINQVLMYVRIIVPILIILLGSLDFARAAISSKEDEMKKAQKTFVRRLIAGVAVFFAPVIVNLIMQLADIVWEGLGYTSCNL